MCGTAAGMLPQHQLLSLAAFVADLKISASLEAQSRGCSFTVSAVDPGLAIDVDRDMLLSAAGNLLQNAFKFTRPNTEVLLRAYAVGDRIRMEVEDRCGGLPVGTQNLFLSFAQGGENRSGLGLGLSICQRSVKANRGVLSMRDIAGSGCVFTIDLPRHTLP